MTDCWQDLKKLLNLMLYTKCECDNGPRMCGGTSFLVRAALIQAVESLNKDGIIRFVIAHESRFMTYWHEDGEDMTTRPSRSGYLSRKYKQAAV